MFCPKCGGLLLPKKEGGKKVLSCSCGYSGEEAESKITEKLDSEKQEVEVVQDNVDILPIMEIKCPKCEHGEAHFWTSQTRAGDEPETKFMKCVKCKHTWRDYS